MSNQVEAGAEDYNLGAWNIVMHPDDTEDYTDRNYDHNCGNPGARILATAHITPQPTIQERTMAVPIQETGGVDFTCAVC